MPCSPGGRQTAPREIECLKWAAQGKSAWETGRIHGISRHTVAFYLDNAKAKLGVRSTVQAVALCSKKRALNATMFGPLDERTLADLNVKLKLIGKNSQRAAQQLAIDLL